MPDILLFTYGTLKQGHRNHHLLKNATFLGTHRLPGYTAINYHDFPIAIEKQDAHLVGEMYKIDEQTLRSLDYLEGYPYLYGRNEVETPYGQAIIYYGKSARRQVNEKRLGYVEEWR